MTAGTATLEVLYKPYELHLHLLAQLALFLSKWLVLHITLCLIGFLAFQVDIPNWSSRTIFLGRQCVFMFVTRLNFTGTELLLLEVQKRCRNSLFGITC